MIPVDIRSVLLSGFMSYADSAQLQLPRTGAVLITGKNGSGKSSLMEAVAWALWGKTLRGTPPYSEDGDKRAEETEVLLELGDGTEVFRKAKRGKPKELSVRVDGDTQAAATVTKSQALVDMHFSPFDSWRRCSVFSGQDLSAFSGASDAERKRLIEAILNIDRFEAAYKNVREQKGAADKRERKLSNELERLEGLMEGLAVARAQAEKETVDVKPLEIKAETARDKLRSTRASIKELRASVRSLRDTHAVARHDLQAAKEKVKRLGDAQCPTCEQPISDELREALQGEVDAAKQAAETAERVYKEQNKLAESEEETYQDIANLLDEQIDRLKVEIRDARANNAAVEEAQTLLDSMSAGREVLDKRRDEHRAARIELRTYEDACKVLGTKGVRAHLLGSTLKAVSSIASAWLQEFSDGELSVDLSAYKENKDGSVNDSITINVEGAGGGYGYKACSGGQKRRVDVALLLGLAQVASSAHGHKGGTLWLDEVFNQLDSQGFDAVGGMVADLAKDRCVAVISHHADIKDVIDFKNVYEVDNGNIRRIK